MYTRLFILSSLLIAALLGSACSGGGGKKFADTVILGADDIQPQLISQELVPGKNRFAFALVDPTGPLIIDAKVHMTFYRLYDDGREEKRFEADALSSVPARDAGIEEAIEHVHPDGTVHIHANVGDQVGIYASVVDFDEAGRWGVELQIDTGKKKQTIRPSFSVGSVATTVPIGSDAPRSVNRTVDDVDDLALIDSSANPSPEMHTQTIAAALDEGRPILLLFAVPGYCTSQFCGPEYEIMRKLYSQYRDRVSFIHVEPYQDPASPDKTLDDLVQAAKDFGLQSEPWFFVIDSAGKVSMKFEGPTSMQELETALSDVLS